MLTEEEKQEITDEIAHYPRKQAAGPEALRIIQRHHGWVSDERLREVAGLLEMTPAELDSVATFYNLIYRKPVGRHVILLCDSVSCWIMGASTIEEHLRMKLRIGLGETTSDKRFTLLPVCCLGACDRAPAMMIDEDLHTNLDAAKIDTILENYP